MATSANMPVADTTSAQATIALFQKKSALFANKSCAILIVVVAVVVLVLSLILVVVVKVMVLSLVILLLLL